MHMKKFWTSGLLGLGLVVTGGCVHQPPVTEGKPAHHAAEYQCGQGYLQVIAYGDQLELTRGEDTRQLRSAPSASGARYIADGDSKTEFWNKGNSASVMIDGQKLPECVQTGTLPPTLTARGNEPFWSVQWHAGQMTLRTPEAETAFGGEAQHIGENRWLISSVEGPVRLELTRNLCQDSMAGMYYPWSARLLSDGQAHPGCAGDPAQLLQGIEWQLTRLDNAPVGTDNPVTLSFDPEGRIYGHAACNHYFGSYTLTGEGLSLGSIGSTLMACQGDAMTLEQQFLQALAEVRAFAVEESPLRLRLTGPHSLVLEARPAQDGD